jgi:hypothetical protein
MDENLNKDITVNDYVVCTLASWHAQYDKEAIKKTAMDCFGESELIAAMTAFCYNESITGAVVPDQKHRKKDKCFDAIYRQIVSLDASGQMPKLIVECNDLFKVPRRVPGENVDDPTLDRIACLERTVSKVVSMNETILSELLDLKKNQQANKGVPSFTEIVAQQAVASRPVVLRQQDRIPVTQARNHISVQSVIPSEERNQSNIHQSEAINGNPVLNAGHGSSHVNEGWQDANRRRRPRPKAIQGTYKSQGDNTARWAAAPRNIFVYHTDRNASEEDISALIEETSKVEVLEIEKKSHIAAYHGSFRVSVRRNDFEKAMLPEHWPDGWSVREYFQPRPKRQLESVDNNMVQVIS